MAPFLAGAATPVAPHWRVARAEAAPHGPAPGSGRGEAPAVVPHPPTPRGVGGGLGGARSSLAMPNTPNTRETAFGWVSVGPNPLNFQN
jgi:hypothetical protein